MTPDAIRALFAKRQRAWEARDVAAFAAIYADDCVVEGQMAGTLHGRQAVETAERELFAVFPDMRLEGMELLVIGNQVVMTATVTGTDGRGTLAKPGTQVRFPIVMLNTVQDGRIVAERRLWDFSGFVLQRVQSDLKDAAEIQQQLLPDGHLEGENFALAAASVPCRTLGGDFFEYFELSSGNLALTLGDIAGKGPPSSLLSASLQAILRLSPQPDGPAATLGIANREMLRRAVPSRFATVVYATLTRDGRLTYCNAGHNPALVVGASGQRWLQQGGTVLGVFDRATFEEDTLQLHDGDCLVAYSDGITEAQSADGTEFGEERLAACVESNRGLGPQQLVRLILDTVQQFSAGTSQGDDRTVLVLTFSRPRVPS